MLTEQINEEVVKRGKAFFSSIESEKPSLFNKGEWIGKVLDWSMRNPAFKANLFRFVDVFPYLKSSKSLTKHIQEYFAGDDQDVPAVLKWGAKASVLGGFIGGKILNTAISYNIKHMAGQFIIGENSKDAIKNTLKLRKDGFAFVMDLLGESAVNRKEAQKHLADYIDLIKDLAQEQNSWDALNSASNGKDWGYAPKIQISVKLSALYWDLKPSDLEGSVQKVLEPLAAVYQEIIDVGGSLCIDMESYKYKNITLEVFRRLRSDERFKHYTHLGIVLQAYLKDTEKDLNELITWSREQNLLIEVRLVKGAYWDFETIEAQKHGWESPVWAKKPETDLNYELLSEIILKNNDTCYFACGSHNIRSVAAVISMAEKLNVPENRYEFQVLYGMAEPVRKGIRNIAGRTRLYCPYGEMVPGMAYLVRRLLENTANESFLRQSFVDEVGMEKLLDHPKNAINDATAPLAKKPAYLENEPSVNFAKDKDAPRKFRSAIESVRSQLPKKIPLLINGKEIETGTEFKSTNPNKPSELVASAAEAGIKEIDQAMEAAKNAFPAWRDRPFAERAGYLVRAAEVSRKRIYELCAWQTLEVGKQWDQAYADVIEAIDFLEYYALEMIRLGKPIQLGNLPGESNKYFYEPKGIAAVISPWNFPLAISLGMVSAAIVTGNTVLFKPSGDALAIGWNIAEIFQEVGLPKGVFNYVPGRGSVIGDYIVEHPDISLIAFTGSKETGLRIIEKAAKVQEGQRNVKKVICEMGGKNAIILDDDADLDEAIPAIIYSAFGFQGQKCSACSRLIVLDEIYERAMDRLVNSAKCLSIGSPEDPSNDFGAVINEVAQKSILKYQEIAKKEGKVLYCSENVPSEGSYVPALVVDGIRPKDVIAQEEVFGPVLAVMRAKDFDQAIEYANSTKFALTGAIFSRSPKNLERAQREFRVGNLYLNQGSTGAIVGRQAFGGAAMSGAGTKAGGPDYLLHFMDPRVVTENTMRRGFVPES